MNNFEDCLSSIQEWLDDEGVFLAFHEEMVGHYFVSWNDRLQGPAILISKHSSEEIQLYSLLHEMGHYLLRKNSREDKWNASNDDFESDNGRIDLAREEVLAWEQAEEIAKRIKVWDSVDANKWDEHVRECLFGYMKFAVDPGEE